MPRRLTCDPDRTRLNAAAFFRSLSVGMTGVLLALYLAATGWDVQQVGLLVSVGLAGAAAGTFAVSFLADLARRRTLVVLGVLQTLGGLGLTFVESHGLLLAAAFVGMVNGMGRDRGPAYALEQAVIPETTTPERRTFALAWYNLAMDAGLALGSLLAGLPFLLRERFGWAEAGSYRAAWLVYAAVSLVALACYAGLSSRIEVRRSDNAPRRSPWPAVSPESKRRVAKLAALTGLDSLGGGFLTGALVSYWFFRRFGLGEEWLGPVFFAARAANAASHLVAAWLARRIGLVNTMVFTHIPSSLFLIAVPFAPNAGWAVGLFLLREALVEMDVPTRQSYILAVVRPEERAFSSGVTLLTRNIAYAAAPAAAGAAMQSLALASPLFFGAGIKIAYDVLLYLGFRHIRPPEEA